jgi:hypothetical protein
VYGQHHAPAGPLSKQHSSILTKGSSIAPRVIAARGYRTIRRRSEVPDDFADWQRRLGLLVPTYSPSGTRGHQLRPERPIKRKNGSAPKYETPRGSRITLDVNPIMLEQVRAGDADLFLTEGCKKVDALTSQGFPTVGIIGVWNFAVPGSKSTRPLQCWSHVRLEGRRVIVVYDADARTNPDVQEALRRLVAMLEKLGAVVLVVYLPAVDGDGKAGVDDYLAAGGTVAELRMMAGPYHPLDVGAERMGRDEKLRAGVEDLERRFWATEWKGMGGHSARDVYLKLIEAAKRSGKVHRDGMRVVKAQGPLALEAKVSGRTLWKALNRLTDMGLLYRDNEGRKADATGAFVLRAKVSHKGRRGAGEDKATTPLQAYDPGDLHLRAPRQRWSSPSRKRQPRYGMIPGTRQVRSKPTTEARVPDEKLAGVPRLGKIRGAILDAHLAGVSAAILRPVVKSYEARDAGIAAMRERAAAAAKAEEQKRAEAFVRDRLAVLGRIRLELLRDIWQDEGGDPWTIPPAIEALGCRVERLPEYENRRFVFPPAEEVA